MTESMRRELGVHHGIRVNTVSLGVINTGWADKVTDPGGRNTVRLKRASHLGYFFFAVLRGAAAGAGGAAGGAESIRALYIDSEFGSSDVHTDSTRQVASPTLM